jgi:hypothetical protein
MLAGKTPKYMSFFIPFDTQDFKYMRQHLATGEQMGRLAQFSQLALVV